MTNGYTTCPGTTRPECSVCRRCGNPLPGEPTIEPAINLLNGACPNMIQPLATYLANNTGGGR